MKRMYDRILPQIVSEFKIANESNIELIKQMNTGFSGAEIYAIELKHPSSRTGKYFLKIDEKDEEFQNLDVSKRFPCAAKYIDKAVIDGLYVLLIEIAGGSSVEYKSFFASEVSIKKSMTSSIVESMLDYSFSKDTFHSVEMPLSEICSNMLTNKVSDKSAIKGFLEHYLSNAETPSISVEGDVLPNAFYYARHACDLSEIYYLNAAAHGDFHGDNVFLAQSCKDYAVIDWALAREDGILFFDSAYFELSLLLRSLESYSLKDWVEIVKGICVERWDNLDFKDAVVIENIHRTENNWINTVNDTSFSHVDKMKYGRYIARMLAGLNFSGKRKTDRAKKEKAFIFSCVFLKKLFDLANYAGWRDKEIERWNTVAFGGHPDMNTALKLAQYCTHFSEQYQYILISGGNPLLSDLTNEYVARIPWSGIISLSNKTNEALYTKISESRLLRNLLLDQKCSDIENNIQQGAVWWMFADGFESNPVTLTDKFAQWRNKYSSFLQKTISKICSAASPQELMLIIDYGSFVQGNEWNKVQQILEWFDQNESATIEASVLALGLKKGLDEERLANITLKHFNMNMECLAYYASSYLSGIRKTGIWLPHIEKKIGIQLEEPDAKYITSYLEVIGDHLLNNRADDQTRRAFYWGESITWDAIDNKILVDRSEVQSYVEIIKKKVADEKWGIINLGHTPGAGATVLGKSICWQLRSEYPTVQIRQISTDLFESFDRIADNTGGSPIIILADGDFTHSDIKTIETALKSSFLKFIILYTYRVYGEKFDDFGDILTCLNIQTAERFEFHYIKEMQMKGSYSEEQLASRKEELGKLTRNVTLAEFRLPFFYGMYAFEEDFVSISEYTNQIINRMKQKPEYQKIVGYIAMITFFTAKSGLSHKVAKKILSMPKHSIRKLLDELNSNLSNFIYVTGSTYRICHPIIAYKILTTQFGTDNSLATVQFSNLCKDFIRDIRQIEGGVDPSEYANQLITDIFVTRGFVDSMDSSVGESKDTPKKNSFATIMLAIGNENLQKEVFSCMVEQFPDNPHCFQHYGRLLISNTPSDIATAKQQFDQAIKLDANNPSHYHARGTMYEKHCKYLLTSKYSNTVDPMDVYNGCKLTVELALNDFEKAIAFSLKNNESKTSMAFFLSYPYSSILNICTLIIRAIMEKYGLKYDIQHFWEMETNAAHWCHSLLARANKYDFETETVYPEVSKDEFYRGAKNNLTKIKLDPNKIQKLIEQNPDENSLKFIYLGSVDTRRETLKRKTQEELSIIQNYCEEIITTSEPYGGILWKWFNAYIRMDNFDYTHALGFLETLPNIEDNITANFLLQIIYFCKFFKTNNSDDADRALNYQVRCKKLGRNNPKRRSARCFLTDLGIVTLTNDKESAVKFPCTIVDEVTKEQSAEMSLDMDTRFKVFFVPYHNKVIKVGQGFAQKVNAIIGFSYSGLRGFELELR